jgi:hypothetical protein
MKPESRSTSNRLPRFAPFARPGRKLVTREAVMRRGLGSWGTSLEREQAAATHNRCVNLFVPIPAIQATVGIKNSAKQLVQVSPLKPSLPITSVDQHSRPLRLL